MENISVWNNAGFINTKINKSNYNKKKSSNFAGIRLSSSVFNQVNDVVVNFFSHLKSLGMSKDPDLMILSSKNHYYYNQNDLKKVRTSVNLKKLNDINRLDMFLSNVISVSPPDTNFIGYFSDCKIPKRDNNLYSQDSGLINRFIKFLYSGTEHVMDKNEVLELLETYGFKIIDSKEITGLTFFHSENTHRKVELREAS